MGACAISTDPIAHYVIIRRDLPLGLMAAQIIHAAGESSPGNLESGTYAIALQAPDEPSLLAIEQQLRDLKHTSIRETQGVYAGQLMAIGIAPGRKGEIGRRLSSLPLLK